MQLFTFDDIRRVAVLSAAPESAAACALAGYTVRSYAPDENALTILRAELNDMFDELLRNQKYSVSAIGAARARIYCTDDPSAALMDVQLVLTGSADASLVQLVDTYVSPRAMVCAEGLTEALAAKSRRSTRWLTLTDGVPEPLPGTDRQAFETARQFHISIL